MVEIFAVVRVRGRRNINPTIKKTLEHLRLNRPNHCVLVRPIPPVLGMLNKVKDYVTFGALSEEVLLKLLRKRGRLEGKLLGKVKKEEEIKKIAKEILEGKKVSELINPVFRLHPPRRGYKSIKLPYPRGSLGKRESMDDLLRRMM